MNGKTEKSRWTTLANSLVMKSPTRAISWALDFINTDLSQMDKIERQKITLEFYNALMGMDENSAPDLNLKLEVVQGNLRFFFDTYIRPVLPSERNRATYKLLDPPFLDMIRSVERGVFATKDGISLLSGAPSPEFAAIHNFLYAFERASPLPYEVIRKCKGCGNYFIPFGKRVRRSRLFCNSSCNSRYHASKRREADPEGYRKKQRELMRERYAAKIKDEKKGKVTPNLKRRKD